MALDLNKLTTSTLTQRSDGKGWDLLSKTERGREHKTIHTTPQMATKFHDKWFPNSKLTLDFRGEPMKPTRGW